VTTLHNLEAEQALLGALMDQPESFEAVADRLAAESFYDPVHGRIYEAIKARVEAAALGDAVGVFQRLGDDAGLAELGGAEYLGKLQLDAPSAVTAPAYCDLVTEAAQRRKLKALAQTLTEEAEAAEVTPQAAQERAEAALAASAGTSAERRVMTASFALDAALKSRDAGMATGWADLDRAFLGWRKGRLYIAAGRPGMGKSLFGAHAALNVARAGGPVAFVSLEMSAEEVALRLAGAVSGLAYSEIERGVRDEAMARAVSAAQETLHDLPYTILDMPGAGVGAIRARLRRLDRESVRARGRGLALVVIDYMGLMGSESRAQASIYEQATEKSNGLKHMARALDLPVLCLSQLNRQVEQRSDKRPMLADLRDSGAVEQDADAVFGLFRDAYYAAQEPAREDAAEELARIDRAGRRELDLIILKQRHGRTGAVRLFCDPATGRIASYDERSAA